MNQVNAENLGNESWGVMTSILIRFVGRSVYEFLSCNPMLMTFSFSLETSHVWKRLTGLMKTFEKNPPKFVNILKTPFNFTIFFAPFFLFFYFSRQKLFPYDILFWINELLCYIMQLCRHDLDMNSKWTNKYCLDMPTAKQPKRILFKRRSLFKHCENRNRLKTRMIAETHENTFSPTLWLPVFWVISSQLELLFQLRLISLAYGGSLVFPSLGLVARLLVCFLINNNDTINRLQNP